MAGLEALLWIGLFVLWLILILAQFRLFSIDRTLKKILAQLEAAPSAAPLAKQMLPLTTGIERSAPRSLVLTIFFVCILSLMVAAIFYAFKIELRSGRTKANQDAALQSLVTIVTQAAVYSSLHPRDGYPKTIALLGPAGENLIGAHLADGEAWGYLFSYRPRQSKAGRVIGFVLTARPKEFTKTGSRAFYTDETGIIRFTVLDEEPTQTHPTIH